MTLFTILSMAVERRGLCRRRGRPTGASPEAPVAAAAEDAGAEEADREEDDECDPDRLPAERSQVDADRVVGRGAGRHRERRGEGEYLRKGCKIAARRARRGG